MRAGAYPEEVVRLTVLWLVACYALARWRRARRDIMLSRWQCSSLPVVLVLCEVHQVPKW